MIDVSSTMPVGRSREFVREQTSMPDFAHELAKNDGKTLDHEMSDQLPAAKVSTPEHAFPAAIPAMEAIPPRQAL